MLLLNAIYLLYQYCEKEYFFFLKLVKLRLFPAEISAFFVKLIKDTIHVREEHGVVRPDMIQQLLEARKGKKHEESPNGIIDTGFATVDESALTANKNVKQSLTDLDLAAQALIFFFAGFDTVSTLMYFMSYELALNPNIQQRLQKEIDDTLKECNGDLTYEALLKMKYMDMVVCGMYAIIYYLPSINFHILLSLFLIIQIFSIFLITYLII